MTKVRGETRLSSSWLTSGELLLGCSEGRRPTSPLLDDPPGGSCSPIKSRLFGWGCLALSLSGIVLFFGVLTGISGGGGLSPAATRASSSRFGASSGPPKVRVRDRGSREVNAIGAFFCCTGFFPFGPISSSSSISTPRSSLTTIVSSRELGDLGGDLGDFVFIVVTLASPSSLWSGRLALLATGTNSFYFRTREKNVTKNR